MRNRRGAWITSGRLMNCGHFSPQLFGARTVRFRVSVSAGFPYAPTLLRHTKVDAAAVLRVAHYLPLSWHLRG